MRHHAGTFGLGDAMVGVALLALVLGVARASPPAGVGVAAILGMAAHRVRAVIRHGDAAGRAAGPGRRVALWADSVLVALQVVLGTGLIGLLAGLVFGIVGSGLAELGEAIGVGWRLTPVGMLATLLGTLASMLWGARYLRRAYWPGPDGPARGGPTPPEAVPREVSPL